MIWSFFFFFALVEYSTIIASFNAIHNIITEYTIWWIVAFKVNPVDLAPQYSSVLTGIVRSGVLGASISTAIAGTLRQKVGFQFPNFFKDQIFHF